MIKSIFAPLHPNALKALLDELFADALKHTAIPEADVVFGSADSAIADLVGWVKRSSIWVDHLSGKNQAEPNI